MKTYFPVWPVSWYGMSKVLGEATAKRHYKIAGLESICLRIGFVAKEDNPKKIPARQVSNYISHRDLIQLFLKSISSDKKFGIYYGVSNKKPRSWDISNAIKDLGYEPKSDSSEYKVNDF